MQNKENNISEQAWACGYVRPKGSQISRENFVRGQKSTMHLDRRVFEACFAQKKSKLKVA